MILPAQFKLVEEQPSANTRGGAWGELQEADRVYARKDEAG